jgi:heat shock protein HslJ
MGNFLADAGRRHAQSRVLMMDLGGETLLFDVRNSQRLRPQDARSGAAEPLFVRHRDGNRFSASVGCNTVLGWLSADGGLTFTVSMRTTMACDDDLAGWEARLAVVLSATKRHSICGHNLRLQDEKGAVVAELEAVYVP